VTPTFLKHTCVVLVLTLAGLTLACGKRGPLYLPPPAEAPPAAPEAGR
jgi:predicted small lipoprotein YifL